MHTSNKTTMQQYQQHHYIDRRRPQQLMDNSDKTRNDEFYVKLERLRSTTAASTSKQCSHRSATELLDETKAFFVKSQEVLRNRQTLRSNKTSNEQQQQQQQRMTPSFRMAQPRRSPYNYDEYEDDRFRLDSLDLSLRSSTHSISTPNSTTKSSDGAAFESVSLLSFSDQTTLDSTNSLSNIKRTVVPSTSVTVIERNARIIKWLFQLNKANASPSFPDFR
ncbi:unnamed protein product [Rotaria magnacalcarata]|uniref:Centrosome-associated FAM110 C-terminal domain-containing protein n=2 Tax=Rotaria magnacalcarata TaxID=392030 RepID=A0A815VCA3_9BILA|nr:unnamed protein product [Rotaria magnacalcarata]CAF1944065.1 unnamed protein product [Rotaria magnacalcarata]CAF3772237.1 unnamed protein product [Rotaria magnacalcarata]CAF3867847.1 unnamed protein product [Rotaria magnacalcarata]CAF4052305.1 unnamed protein product [Rotaria magnacalcarata]